jgi:serine/threonine-protein kinase
VISHRFQHIKDIFHDALGQPPEERASYLHGRCAGDTALQRDVQSLLDAHDPEDTFMRPPTAQELEGVVDPRHADSLVGQRIGAYELRRLIGAGGMGEVYLARRADGVFEQEVAVKIVKRGMDTDALLRRFHAERQTLATLNHPNIARLIDGGATDDGRPYLVMEYVEGLPIDSYCRVRSADTRQRLELFIKVCTAVHYAHQHLLVHRDLKPANIVVTEDGEPKLLDFGIAKITDPRRSDDHGATTAQPLRLMTPEYASPEHVRGERITTASDVYSLGVTLYELLTGKRPYRITTSVQSEIEQVVCEHEPEKPSTAVSDIEATHSETPLGDGDDGTRSRLLSTRRLRQQLVGDLDNIVLMALRKEPHRRYGSVQALSDDVRRHLDGLPVLARADTLGYRTSKFVRRHWGGVLAGAAVLILLLAGVTATAWQARRATQQRDNAVAAHRRAELALDFLDEMLSSVDPRRARGRDVTILRELLEQAAYRAESEFTSEPEVEAVVRTTIGNAYRSLGLYDQARPHLETAVSLHRQLEVRSDPEFARALTGLGRLLYETGENESALILFEEEIGVTRGLHGESSTAVALSLNNIAAVLKRLGRLDEAEPRYTESLEIRRKMLGDDHPDVAESLNNLAALYEARGQVDRSLELCREALAIRRNSLGEDHPDTIQSLDNLAVALARKGDLESAADLMREASTQYLRLVGENHPDYATSLSNLGRVLYALHRFDEAEPLLQKTLEIRCRLLPVGANARLSAAISLGRCLSALGRFEGAISVLEKERQALFAAFGPDDERTTLLTESLREIQAKHAGGDVTSPSPTAAATKTDASMTQPSG